MSDAVIIWGMICTTILFLVFGLVGIFAWIDRYTYSELARIRDLEYKVKKIEEKGSEFEMERSTISGQKPWVTLTKTKHKRR